MKEEPAPVDSLPVEAPKAQEYTQQKPSQIPTFESNPNSTGQQSYASKMSTAAPSPSYTQIQTQQIPTYEQPQPSEYREQQAPRNDGGYQNMAANERTIRPSEMKDEG